MTQKELLYIEDAIEHESTIISVCEDMIDNLEDEGLVSFMEEQLEKHTNMKNDLITILEDKNNE